MKKFLFLSVALFSFTAFSADISTKKMMIRGVDKITGHVSTVEATVGQSLEFGSLTIFPEKCLTKPQEEMPENAAFFRVFEKDIENSSSIPLSKGIFDFTQFIFVSPLSHKAGFLISLILIFLS